MKRTKQLKTANAPRGDFNGNHVSGGVLRNDNAMSYHGVSSAKLTWDELAERDLKK